jgi:hypothetical protein
MGFVLGNDGVLGGWCRWMDGYGYGMGYGALYD